MTEKNAFKVPPKQVGIWIRVSTEDQAHGDSPEHHEKRARMYAESRGWEVKEIYHLEGVSGKSVKDEPECHRLLDDVRSGRIQGLIFSKLARLARNTRELLDFADVFRDSNCDLISLQESIDTSTPAGRLFYTMIAAMAQWEREEIADRVQASIAIRAKLGKPLNGKATLGYHWVEKKLEVHKDEAPVRKLMYELYAEHRRLKTVARMLNDRGYRTRGGFQFSDTTVERLIEDPTAKGLHRANYTRRVAGDKPWALKPEHEWVMTPVEPIVSPELWQQCNDLLEARRTKLARPGKRPVHLFAGVTFCQCGTKMYVPSNTPKYVCTKCRNKIPIMDLENIFLEELKDYLLSPEHVAEYLEKANKAIAEKTELVETLRKDRARIKGEIDNLFKLYGERKITSDQFGEQNAPLYGRSKQIEAEIPRIEAELDLLKIDNLSTEQIMSEARDLYGRWPKLTTEEKRRFVELLVKEIIIGDKEITINLCYYPASEDMAIKQRML